MGRFENHKVGDINGNPNKRTIRRPTGGRYILAYAKKLNDHFKKYIVGEYFKSITKIAIVFRVSGKIWDFKSQGVENLRCLKKTKTLTVDLVFSQSQWLNADLNELSEMIAQGTLLCFELIIEKSENWEN